MFDNIYSIQLQCEPSVYAKRTGMHRIRYEMKTDLELIWFESQLKFARSKDKMIIVNVHHPDHWKSDSAYNKFEKLVNEYNVKAIF